jgi:hypothetical protein
MNKATNGKAGRGLGAAPGSVTVEIYRFTPDKPPKGWKRKMGIIGWQGDELYIPAGAAGMSDTEALLCLGYDGEPACFAFDVLLIREAWARREKPGRQNVYDAIRKRALEMRESSNDGTELPARVTTAAHNNQKL